MSQVCTICSNSNRSDIDAALVNGTPNRRIAAQYALSEQAVRRHKADHLAAHLVEAHAAAEEVRALDVVRQLKTINAAALAVLATARASGEHELVLKAVDRVLKQIELQARLIGEIDERPQVNILLSADYLALREVILRALHPYMEARLATAAALARYEGRNGMKHDE